MSIAEIERKSNLGNGTIRRWADSIPSADKLYRVSKVLGVSIEYLLSGEEPIENEKSKLIARKASSLSAEQLDAVLNMIDVFKNK
ncbi:helix-turn-helix domain-containing protein [Peptostreptococcus sp. D1]|uniref:helix-turn-helix domain-containing protein n=1 Tax=Peptostreptococcus sp. D1 TaxID=72304 RepID=UPI001A9A318A|nr:XRE family transcriptional regulator [Peptostreptococcus sp. D1]